MPLRTCKTILQQIVSLYGERVFDELDRMALGDGSFVEAYLRRLLGNATGPSAQRSAHELRRVDSTMSTRSVLSEAASAVSAPTSDIAPPDDRELNQQLKEIFDAVGQPDKSKQVGFTSCCKLIGG
jgi:cytoskeleton-associated protein 5